MTPSPKKIYNLADHPYSFELRELNIDKDIAIRNQVGAINSGEKRKPKKGEWYLSGAIVEAYKAPNNLVTEYYIAKLVKFTKIETKRIDKILD